MVAVWSHTHALIENTCNDSELCEESESFKVYVRTCTVVILAKQNT